MVARLAVFDIDDTLLASNKRLLPSTIASIQALKDRNIHVAIATGRNLAMARPVIEALKLRDYVLCNGSAAFADRKQVHQRTLSKANIGKLVAAADEQQIDIVVESLDGLHIHTHPSSQTQDVLNTFRTPTLDYAPDYYRNHDVYQAMMFYSDSQNQALPHPDEFSFVRFHERGVDIIPKAGSKAQGIAKLAAALNVDVKNVAAFGDNENDREMLQSAGIGVAMGNAKPAIKALADLTTTDCDHDGIANGLKKIGWL